MEVSVIVRLVALVEELDACKVGEVSLDVMDGFCWRLEMIYRELLAKEASKSLFSIPLSTGSNCDLYLPLSSSL